MPGVPSNKACERCKKRHLKCDEAKPSCLRCTNAGAECPGYVQMRKFIDQGATVRRRYAPYQEVSPKSSVRKDHEGATENAEPLDLAQGSAQHSLPEGHGLEHGLDALSSLKPQPAFPLFQNHPTDVPIHDSSSHGAGADAMLPHYSTSSQARSSSSRSSVAFPSGPAQGPVYNGVPQRPSNAGLVPPGSPPAEKEEFNDIFSEIMMGGEHETSFLIRHFSEILGPWLDVSDSRKYFSAYVPIRALNEPFLKHAIAALAAKHLGRMKGATFPVAAGMFSTPATMEVYPNAPSVDWCMKGMNYYYLASSNMNAAASDSYAPVSSSALLESPIQITGRWLNLHLKSGLGRLGGALPNESFWRTTENLLAAAAILSLYRLIDEPGTKWQSHLNGIKPLFDSLMQMHSDSSEQAPRFSHGVSAAFWNFARQDYIAAYYTRIPPHIDPYDLPLWFAAGIPISQDGNLDTSLQNDPFQFHEDLAANSLIWHLSKTVNFLAEVRKYQIEQWVGQDHPEDTTPTSASPPRSSATTSTWLKLSFDLQTWFEQVPETFRPCLRLETPKDLAKFPEPHYMPFPEIFYGLASCAAAMQHYHFGRLALMLNRPPDAAVSPPTAYDRLQGYRDLTKEVDYRCKEIAGVALGRPQGAVRIYAVPLLFAVGQCLESPEERQIICDLLQGVQADLGLATDPQIEGLQRLWAERAL